MARGQNLGRVGSWTPPVLEKSRYQGTDLRQTGSGSMAAVEGDPTVDCGKCVAESEVLGAVFG